MPNQGTTPNEDVLSGDQDAVAAAESAADGESGDRLRRLHSQRIRWAGWLRSPVW